MDHEKRCPIWAQIKGKLARLLRALVLYMDDLLLLGGGCCFVSAAWEALGRPAGMAVAGGCLCAFALVIAKSRKGGEGR